MVSLEEAQAAETRERAAVAEVERRLQELRARDDALAKVPCPCLLCDDCLLSGYAASVLLFCVDCFSCSQATVTRLSRTSGTPALTPPDPVSPRPAHLTISDRQHDPQDRRRHRGGPG